MPAVFSVLCLLCVMLRVGSFLSSCTPTVSTLDLGCHLQWICSDIDIGTTFSVQTKAQGEEWQNVSECFQISSYSCDVSQAFIGFALFKFIRLEINHGHGKIEQTSSQLCDPLKDLDARFSPPSVSVYLEKNVLRVEVAFVCLLSLDCWNEEDEDEEDDDEDMTLSCCPLTNFLKANTTVAVYNRHDAAETQTQSEVFHSSPESMVFGSLTGGQEYCAVARFASSPLSDPQCVRVPSQESLSVVILCGVLIALLLIVISVLVRLCASSDSRLPKSLMSLQNMDHDFPFVAESEQTEDENSTVLLSIVPFSSLSNLSETQLTGLHSPRLGNGYYMSQILQHQAFDEQHGDEESNIETDGDASPDHYPRHLWPSDPAHTTGPPGSPEASHQQGHLCIPLSSVKVAGVQREDVDELPKILMNVNIGGGSL